MNREAVVTAKILCRVSRIGNKRGDVGIAPYTTA